MLSRVVALTLALVVPASAFAEDDFLKAVAAYKKNDFKSARDFAEAAAKADPKREDAFSLVGMANLQLKDNNAAAAAFTKVIELNPKAVSAYDRRGDARLKTGDFKGSVADFDKMLELNPDFAPEHWRRGIALYYAEKYAEGAKQFETHKKANPEDVENAAWHYLCNAKVIGKDKARKELIDVTKDRRVPMKEIQKLFAGTLKPEDVMAAADAVKADTPEGTEARFYAHLYVGLWYAAEGDTKKVLEHLTPAVEKYKIGHYMWDVANIHLKMLKKADPK